MQSGDKFLGKVDNPSEIEIAEDLSKLCMKDWENTDLYNLSFQLAYTEIRRKIIYSSSLYREGDL